MRKHFIVISSTDYKYYKGVLKYPFILASYLEFQKNQDLVNVYKNSEIIIDSGAFSFLNNKKDSKIDFEKYAIEYANFIKKYNIENYIELDIYKIIGVKETVELRKKIEKIIGRKSIPVYHIYLDKDILNEMIKNYNYIAIGGFVTGEIKKDYYPKIKNIIDYCNSKNVKTHVLGRGLETVEKYDFKNYSQDSVGWKSTMYKSYYSIRNNKLVTNSEKRNFKLKKYDVENNNLEIFKYYMGLKNYGK